MEKNNRTITKIIIVDACRDNPGGVRGEQVEEIAPITTPRGTLIAFSTTSGEKAADYGYPNNSAYTGALVHHLKNNGNIGAESLFKRVRQSVYSITAGRKVTWEHTSLINDFYFQKHSTNKVDFGYPEGYINDSSYDYADKTIPPLVTMLQTGNWYKQDESLVEFISLPSAKYASNEKFLMGRWVVRAAANGTFKAKHLINDNIVAFLIEYSEKGKINHLLNGMLFELYFNNLGQFRFSSTNAEAACVLLQLRNNGLFDASFTYLNNALAPFVSSLLYYPVRKDNRNIITFDVLTTEDAYWAGKRQVVKSIHTNAREITAEITATLGASITFEDQFKQSLTSFNIPIDLISINSPVRLNNIEIMMPGAKDQVPVF